MEHPLRTKVQGKTAKLQVLNQKYWYPKITSRFQGLKVRKRGRQTLTIFQQIIMQKMKSLKIRTKKKNQNS